MYLSREDRRIEVMMPEASPDPFPVYYPIQETRIRHRDSLTFPRSIEDRVVRSIMSRMQHPPSSNMHTYRS